MDAQVKSAIVGAELPEGYRFTSASDTALSIEITFSSTENLGDLWKELVVIDENGNEDHTSLYTVTFTDGKESDTPTFVFGVDREAKGFSLRFPDGQEIDLTPILEFK
jgi:hypothetical protein